MADSETIFTPPLTDIQPITQQLHELGLQETTVANKKAYAIEFTKDSPNPELINKLKETLKGKKVAVELGPTSDLMSLSYAAKRAGADVVIGIDPYFDLNQSSETTSGTQNDTQIILLKGDGWGDRRIWDLFGDSDKKESKLATYAQLVNPDSDQVDRMMTATIAKTSRDFLVVLDSGALELLQSRKIAQQDVKYGLLKEAGFENPTDLDWIKHIHRRSKVTELDSEVYRQGMENGMFPPTSYIRKGNMLLFENQPLG